MNIHSCASKCLNYSAWDDSWLVPAVILADLIYSQAVLAPCQHRDFRCLICRTIRRCSLSTDSWLAFTGPLVSSPFVFPHLASSLLLTITHRNVAPVRRAMQMQSSPRLHVAANSR